MSIRPIVLLWLMLIFSLRVFLKWPDSTFRFLLEKWKDHSPPGYLLKEASVDHPFEEDPCRCDFSFDPEDNASDTQLVLTYQWFIGERIATNFAALPDATTEVKGSRVIYFSVLTLWLNRTTSFLCHAGDVWWYFLGRYIGQNVKILEKC